MQKLLLISRCPPYPIHLGDRLIIWHLMRELQKRDYQIDLIAFTNREEDWQEQANYQQFFQSIRLIMEPQRTQWQYLQRILQPGYRFPQTAAQAWSPDMWQAIESRLSQSKYDAIHVFGGIQVYEYVGALQGKPAIITPYESYSLYLKRVVEAKGGGFNHIRRWLAGQFESWMFTPYEHIVVLATPDRDELLRLNPELNIHIIPNGIDTDYFQPPSEERLSDQLIFTGNFEYAPNVDAAMQLAKKILPKVQAVKPAVKLWLVGNAPPPELLALKSDTVEVTGRVPDIREYLNRASIFVCPLVMGAGIKNKVLEALAVGLPVVATPLSVDGIHVTNHEDAIVTSVENMPKEIANLLNNPNLRRQMSQKSRVLIESKYSWAQVADKYNELYKSLSHQRTDHFSSDTPTT